MTCTKGYCEKIVKKSPYFDKKRQKLLDFRQMSSLGGCQNKGGC